MHPRLAPYEFLIWDLDGTLVTIQLDWPRLKQEIRDRWPVLTACQTLTEMIAIARQHDVGNQLIEMIPPFVTIAALVIYNLRRQAQISANARRFQERMEAEQQAA